MKSKFLGFVLEASLLIGLFGLLLILMGTPIIWTCIGWIVATDVAIIWFLGHKQEPPTRPRSNRRPEASMPSRFHLTHG
jgi:hypothetical protein